MRLSSSEKSLLKESEKASQREQKVLNALKAVEDIVTSDSEDAL